MVNLGVYLKDLSNDKIVACIQQEVERANSQKELCDSSIFFDDIGPLKIKVDFGMFNSTELWNFKGDLVTTSLETLNKSLSYVNNINIFYCFGMGEYNTLGLLRTIDKNNILTIAVNEESANNFYRITRTKPIGITDNFQGITTIIKKYNHERTKNS